MNTIVVTTSTNIADTVDVCLANNDEPITLILPDATTAQYPVIIKKISPGYESTIMVVAPNGQKIDDQIDCILTIPMQTAHLVAANGNWYIV